MTQHRRPLKRSKKLGLLHWLQVATLIDQRVAEVLESDAVKESLQARLEAERKVLRCARPYSTWGEVLPMLSSDPTTHSCQPR